MVAPLGYDLFCFAHFSSVIDPAISQAFIKEVIHVDQPNLAL